MRRSVMRRVCEIALPVLILACTPTGPEPASTKTAEAEPETAKVEPENVGPENVGPEKIQPEKPEKAEPAQEPEPFEWEKPEPPIDPNAQPKFDVVARELSDDPDEGMCPFEVVPYGFPAISEDGAMLVDAQVDKLSRAEMDTYIELTWHAADGVRLVQVRNPREEQPNPNEELPENADLDDCNDSLVKVRAEVAALNEELSSRKWRQLERLDVLYSRPGIGHGVWSELVDTDEVVEGLAGADRPLEVLYHNGYFIARVAGLRVLQKTSQPQWRQPEDEFCTSDGQIHAMKVDRASKLALVYYNFSTGGCLCDERTHVGRIELTPEVFAEAETRSTAKFMAAFELAMNDAL